jgi:outer membrane receptor protein involved in Fe transport
MKLKLLLLLFSVLFAGESQANALNNDRKYELTGTVVDGASGEALEYATVAISDAAGQVLTGAVTDATGGFSIPLAPGEYGLKVQFISFTTYEERIEVKADKDLGAIKLLLDETMLDEVEIVDEKSTVEYKLDKKIYNVGKDITSQGGTVNDVLENVPSVNVDAGGSISLRGNGGVTILVNGKPSVIAANNGLGQIPAQSVEKIEVITNPSARYQAAGTAGIINIVLKRNRIKGLSGSIQLGTGTPANHNASASLSYKNEKMNLFGTVGRRYANFFGRGYTDQVSNADGITTMLNQKLSEDRNDNGFNFFLGGDYYFNERNTLTAAFFHYNVKNTDDKRLEYLYSVAGQADSSVIRDVDYFEPQKFSQLELNYEKTFAQKGKRWTVDFQYDFWNDDENESITNNTFGPSGNQSTELRSRDIESSDDFLLQSDFVQPVGESGRIELGVRAEARVITSDYAVEELLSDSWEVLNGIDNAVDYSERIGGVYFQYGNGFKKFEYLLGLRSETTMIGLADEAGTFNAEKQYTRLFPSATLNYSLSETSKLQMSYSRRIRRPGFWQLNPFGGIEDNNALFAGNPDLNPAYTNSVELGFLKNYKRLTLNPSAYFQQTTDFFQFFVAPQADGSGFLVTPINQGYENRFGIEVAANYRPTKWLQLSAEFNGYQFQQRGAFESERLDIDNAAWFTQFSTRIRLPKQFTLQGQYGYEGRQASAQTITQPVQSLNLGLSKRLFKDKGSLSLSARNVLDSQRRLTLTEGPGYTIEQESRRIGRRYQLTFQYQFNRKPNQRDRQPGRRNR